MRDTIDCLRDQGHLMVAGAGIVLVCDRDEPFIEVTGGLWIFLTNK